MMRGHSKRFCLFIPIIIVGLAFVFCVREYQGSRISKDTDFCICQTDYTKITYADGFYYYQSTADCYYLYRSDESGEHRECLVKQVPKEIYVMRDWVYFTNLSKGSSLFRVRTDGSGMEMVCGERIKRFLPMEGKFYCLAETGDGGKIFACTEDGETETIFEGKCSWLCTDGELLYFEMENTGLAESAGLMKNIGEIEEVRTIAMDGKGDIKAEYGTGMWRLIPTEKYLYYCGTVEVDGEWVYEIVKRNRRTGKTEKYRVPDCEGEWTTFSYAVYHGEIYVFLYSYRHKGDSPAYQFFQYREEEQEFVELCPWVKIDGADTLHSKAEGIYLVNDKIFYKVYAGEGRGQLWHGLGISGGEPVLFEEMEEAVAVNALGGDWLYSVAADVLNGDVLYTGYREGYWEQDIEYNGETGDGLGNVMETYLTVPKIGEVISASPVINGKIREDAEQFYEEQTAFHEMVREKETAQGEWENRSRGSFCCCLAYADERYVSIVYRKEISTYAQSYQKEYVTRLYSSETGEELQIEDLFVADWEEISLRLSFFIRRTETAFDLFGDDLFFPGGTSNRIFYCLTEDGLDVFFVEDMRTFKEWHFIIPYENLEVDILE